MKDIEEIRSSIDGVDQQIVELFKRRIALSDDVASYKKEHKLSIVDRKRERKILQEAAGQVDDDMKSYVQVLMSLLMEASRTRQNADLARANPLGKRLQLRLPLAHHSSHKVLSLLAKASREPTPK